MIKCIVETTVWQNFIVIMESLTKKNQDCHRQNSKSSVSLGAVWLTFDTCLWGTEAVEASSTPHMDSNQVDLSGKLDGFSGFFK